MWPQLIAGGFLVGQFIYHRWFEEPDYVDRPPREYQIPRTEVGTAVQIIYGKVRQNEPVLAWAAVVTASSNVGVKFFFVLGVAMANGAGTSKVHSWYLGDARVPTTGDLDYSGSLGAAFPDGPGGTLVESFGGGASQVLANDGNDETNAPTYAGRAMLKWTTPANVPGYRGYISCHLGNQFSGSPAINVDVDSQRISFEVSSYDPTHAQLGTYNQIGVDLNPINALYDLICRTFGKLGISETYIDVASFQAAQLKLRGEGNGYSRALNSAEAQRHIQEILEQIDGVLRENPKTSKLEVKLIRPDYTINAIPHITKQNCERIENLSVGGWDGVVNKVRLVYTDRESDYKDGSAIAHNQANAVGQDGIVREQVIRMPGVMSQVLADYMARRELAVRSRPIVKLRAICDRSMRDVMQGDAVKLTWESPDIAGMVFRVANVDRGSLESQRVALDLISDAFFQWGSKAPEHISLGDTHTTTKDDTTVDTEVEMVSVPWRTRQE